MSAVRYTPVRADLGRQFFNPDGPVGKFYFVDDLTRMLEQAKNVSFK